MVSPYVSDTIRHIVTFPSFLYSLPEVYYSLLLTWFENITGKMIKITYFLIIADILHADQLKYMHFNFLNPLYMVWNFSDTFTQLKTKCVEKLINNDKNLGHVIYSCMHLFTVLLRD